MHVCYPWLVITWSPFCSTSSQLISGMAEKSFYNELKLCTLIYYPSMERLLVVLGEEKEEAKTKLFLARQQPFDITLGIGGKK